MKSTKNIVNKLIPADDLHWCEIEKKYVSLSKEEINSIIQNCVKQEIHNEEDIIKVVNWACLARTYEIMLNNFMANKVQIVDFFEEEPVFGEKKYEY